MAENWPGGLRGIRKADCMTWWREKSKLVEPTFQAFFPPNYDPSMHFLVGSLFLDSLSKLISFTWKGFVLLDFSHSLLLIYYLYTD